MKKYLLIVLLVGAGFGQAIPDTLTLQGGRQLLGTFIQQGEFFTEFYNWKENHNILNRAITVSHSDIDLDIFLGITRQDLDLRKRQVEEGHTDKFWAKVFTPHTSIDPTKFSHVLTQKDLFLVRAKGHVLGSDQKIYEVQSVGHRSYVRPTQKDKTPGLVLIGTKEHMNFDLLSQSLKEFGSLST